jgi:hypothetical protein
MYWPTRCSGNLPKRLQIECSEPFSQNLREGGRARQWVGAQQFEPVANGSATKGQYALEHDMQIVLRLDVALVLDDVRMLQRSVDPGGQPR